jgi:hypothetical protein
LAGLIKFRNLIRNRDAKTVLVITGTGLKSSPDQMTEKPPMHMSTVEKLQKDIESLGF